jgi:hypothetical protein
LDDARGTDAAAPVGLQQQQAAGTDQVGSGFSALAGARAPKWQSGGNTAGTANGWDTPFWQTYRDQRAEAEKAGDLHGLYGRKDFTGVVTYDQTIGDRHYKLGDVYENGQKTHNLLDGSAGHSEQEGYGILEQLLLSREEQLHANRSLPDDPESVKKAVTDKANSWSKEVAGWETQQAYQSDIDDQKDQWGDAGMWGAIGAGAAGGATLGAAGFLATPIVGAITTVGGAIVGGIGGFLNQDQIIDQAARASVQTSMADEQFGAPAAGATALKDWGGVAMSALSPTTNLVQGAIDAADAADGDGGLGDHKSAFYENDRTWYQTALGLGAGFADGILQFASGAGATATLGAMGASALGGGVQLSTTGMASFDDRTGTFDKPDNILQAGAAIGAVGMDVLQLGMGGAVLRTARLLNGARGGETLLGKISSKLDDGGETVGGIKFLKDADGNVTGHRVSLTVLAPSEAVQGLTVWGEALRNTVGKNAITSQDLYRAATNLQTAARPVKAALVNAFGEGTEEGIQAILEPFSHGWAADFGDVVSAYAQGAVMGAGMTIGARLGRIGAGADLKTLDKVNSIQAFLDPTKAPITPEEWSSMTPDARKAAQTHAPLVERLLEKAAAGTEAAAHREAVKFTAGIDRIVAAVRMQAATEMKSTVDALTTNQTIVHHPSSDTPARAAVGSLNTVRDALARYQRGLDQNVADKSKPDEIRSQYARISAALTVLRQQVDVHAAEYQDGADVTTRRAAIDKINSLIQMAWENEADNRELSRAATLFFARNPWDNAASVQALFPQVAFSTTESGSGDGIWMVGDGILPGMSADFDGDTFQLLAHLVVDEKAFLDARSGTSLLGPERGPNFETRENEAVQINRIGVAFVSNNADLGNATAALKSIEGKLLADLAAVPGITGYVDTLITELKAGVPDAKLRFATKLAVEQGDAMLEISRTGTTRRRGVTDPWLEIIDQHINSELQAFQSQAALRAPSINYETPLQAVPTDPRYNEVLPEMAATPGDTVFQETAGVDPLRAFQSLHYSDYRSEMLAAGFNENDTPIREYLIRWYELLSGGMTQSALDKVLAVDEVQQLGRHYLERLAEAYYPDFRPRAKAMHAIAGLQMPTNIDRYGREYGGTISVGQAVLRDAAQHFARRDAVQLELNPQLATKYSMYENMAPGEAVVELLGAQPTVDFLGEKSGNLASMTVDQVVAFLVNRDPEQRRADFAQLKRDSAYKSTARHDLPYLADEIRSETVSPYQVFVDALQETVSTRLSKNADGTITGRYAEQTKQVQETLEASLSHIHTGLNKFLRMILSAESSRLKLRMPRKKFTTQEIVRVLDQNPDMTRTLLAALPDDIVNIIIHTTPDGRVTLPSWFYDMLTEPNAKRAAVIFFRETFKAELAAYRARHDVKPPQDRLVKLAIDIAKGDPSGQDIIAFMDLVDNATDVTTLMQEINRSWVHGQAPIPAWHRDASLVDSTATQGGWQRGGGPGTLQREVFLKLSRQAKSFHDLAVQEELIEGADAALSLNLLAAVEQEEAGRKSSLSHMLRTLELRLKMAIELPANTLSPNTTKQAILTALAGIGPDMTDKGKPTPAMKPIGKFDAMGQTIWGRGDRKLFGAYTAVDAEDAARDMGSLNKGPQLITLNDGSVVEWSPISSAKQFLTMWRDPEMRPMLRSLVFPSVLEAQPTGQIAQQMLTGQSLEALLSGDTFKNIFLSGTAHNTGLFGALADSLSAKHGGHMEFTRAAKVLAIERANAAKQTLTAAQMEDHVERAYQDLVEFGRAVADTHPDHRTEQLFKVVEELRRREPEPIDEMISSSFKKAIVAAYDSRVQELEESGGSDAEILEAQQRVETVKKVIDGDNNEVRQTLEMYSLDWTSPDVDTKIAAFYEELKDNEWLATAVSGKDGDAIRRIKSATEKHLVHEYPIVSADETETQELWEAAGRALAQARLDRLSTALILGSPTAAIPTNESRLKFWDSSRYYLIEPFLRKDSPLVAALDELRTLTLGENVPRRKVADDLAFVARNKLFADWDIGPWHPGLAIRQVEGEALVDGSGSEAQVQMGGNTYSEQSVLTGATKRTDAVPPATAARSYVLTYKELMSPTHRLVSDVLDDSLQMLNGRFLAGARASFRRANGTLMDVDLFRDAQIRPGFHSNATQGTLDSDYLLTNVDRLRRSVESVVGQDAVDGDIDIELALFHPADMPVNMPNNVFFEGALFENTGDNFDSLNAAAYFAALAIAQYEQRKALDSRKKATQAVKRPSLPGYEAVRAMEAGWETSLYQVITRKTEDFMSRNTGHRVLDATFMPAIHAALKLRHAVRGINAAGQPVLLSANEVIAMQMQGTPLELTNAELVLLSERELNTLLGSHDGNGVTRPITRLSVEIDNWGAWTGSWSDIKVNQLMPGLLAVNEDGTWTKGDIRGSELVQRPYLSQFTAHSALSTSEQARLDNKFAVMREWREKVQRARESTQSPRYRSQASKFAGLLAADDDILSAMPYLAAQEWGLPDGVLRTEGNSDMADLLQRQVTSTLNEVTQASGLSTLWHYVHTRSGGGDRLTGVLHGLNSLNELTGHKAVGDNIASGDGVLIDLASFRDPQQDTLTEVKKVIDRLSGFGVNVILYNSATARDVAYEAGRYLTESRGYTRVPGGQTVYVPATRSSQYQTLQARYSRLGATEKITADSVMALIQTRNDVNRENTMILFGAKDAHNSELKATRDLVPSTAYPFFGHPKTVEQAGLALEQMNMLTTPDGAAELAQLAKLGGETPEVLREKLEYAIANYDVGLGRPKEGSVLRTGDIIPLVNPRGHVIFYRHGLAPISSTEELEMQLASWPTDRTKLAIYGSEIRDQSTTHNFTITQWHETSGYGLSVTGHIPLQALGNKNVFQDTGFKGLTIDAGDTVYADAMPHQFLNGWDINGLIGLDDSISKANEFGRIDNFRNAFGYLGIDLVPAMASVLFKIDENAWSTLSTLEQERLRGEVHSVLERVGRLQAQELRVVEELMSQLTSPGSSASMALQTALGSVGTESGLDKALGASLTGDSLTPQQIITRNALIYMLAGSAKPEHVMSSTGLGFNDPLRSPESTLMPELFTTSLDVAGRRGSPLRKYLFDKLNQNFTNDPARPGVGFELREDWTFVSYAGNGKPPVEGLLQFREVHSSGHNPTSLEMAQNRNTTDSASYQQSLMAQQAFRMSTGTAKALKKTQRYIDRVDVPAIDTPLDVFRMMQGLAAQPAEIGPKATRAFTARERAAMKLYKKAWSGFEIPLDLSFWEDATERDDFIAARRRLAERMGFGAEGEPIIDSMIRMWSGSPKDKDPQSLAAQGRIFPAAAKEALTEIERNLEQNRLPVHDFEHPMLSYQTLDALFTNAVSNPNAWSLLDANGERITDFDVWVDVAIGTAKSAVVDPLFMPAINGAWQTYRESGTSLAGAPISLSMIESLGLLDAETGDLVLSWNRDDNVVINSDMIFDLSNASFSEIYGGEQLHAGRTNDKHPPVSARARRAAARAENRKTNKMQAVQSQTLGDLQERGVHFRNSGTASSALMRIFVNMRLTTGMANPWLYASAPLEAAIWNTLDSARNLLTGEGRSKLNSRWSPKTLQLAEETAQAFAKSSAFNSMINADAFVHPQLYNAGPVERATSSAARFMGKWQDPTYGQRQVTVARSYVLSVMRYYAQQGTGNDIDIDALLVSMKRNPELVRRTDKDRAHKMAMNGIAVSRGLKPTWANLMFRGFVDPLSSNPHFYVNIPSTLMLKLPYLFSNYALGTATKLFGMQFVDQTLSLLMQGRRGGKRFSRFQAILAGDKDNPGDYGIDFLAETSTSIDFADAFITGGMTHTALMGIGLAMGGLGLTGEDDEDRRRRRAEKLQGAGHVYDPRDALNDFRSAEAIWLESLPLVGEYFAYGTDGEGEMRAPAALHWTLKQFVAPAMGIARFIDTGNFAHVAWGFEDAVGSMPLVNTMLYDDAARTANELYAASLDAEHRGSPEDLVNSTNFLMNAVMKLERMLLENSFVNSVYVAADKWDRDPYVLVDVDADGNIQRDNFATPMETDGMKQYLYDNGTPNNPDDDTVRQAYLGRDWSETTLRSYTERQASLAFLGSLFTGLGSSDLWRGNMAVKERTIEKDGMSQDEAEALVLSMWDPENKRETLTRAGAEAVLRGLHMGTVRPGDPALDNVFIPPEMRDAIKDDLMADMLQEGIDLGLGQEAAVKRVNEFWYGSSTNPYAIPLKDVVYSTGKFDGSIGYQPTAKYRQLNTTYVIGPDGKPWATNITRGGLYNAFGQSPIQQFGAADEMDIDSRGNSVDNINDLNTGMRGLVPVHESVANPTDQDILNALNDGMKKAIDAIKTPTWSDGGFPRWANSSGYGGGGGSAYAYRVNSPVRNDPTYGRNTPYIRVDNPYTRRATIRRERFSSQRGRLSQWQ